MNLVRVLALNVLNTKFLIFSAHTKKEKKKEKKKKKNPPTSNVPNSKKGLA